MKLDRSNRGSACLGEYVPGPCTTPPRHAMGVGSTQDGALTAQGAAATVGSMTGRSRNKGSRRGTLRLDHLLSKEDWKQFRSLCTLRTAGLSTVVAAAVASFL